MNQLHGKHIVLGMSGGVAAFKSAELCRRLIKAGATVQVVMTESATQFMTPVTMQALSNRPVYTSQWDPREPNNMPHINLSREADAVVVAPCSADFIARLVQGRADELLSLLCLARPIDRVPLILAPAMNREMWAHPATQRNLRQVQADIRTQSATLASGRARIANLGDALLPAADQRVQLANAAYRAGTGSLADTFGARRAQLDAQLQVLDLRREVSQTWAQLEYQVVPSTLAAAQ